MRFLGRGRRRPKPIDKQIARHFGWLIDLGFEARNTSDGDGTEATFTTAAVTIRVGYEWREGSVDISIARTPERGEGPFWSRVYLRELLRRDERRVEWQEAAQPGNDRELDRALEVGSNLLREVALEQVRGEHLEALDALIATRPRLGTPGLDFPVEEPWWVTDEGFWFTTDFETAPQSAEEVLEASRSPDPLTRAKAALVIHASNRPDRMHLGGLARLRELLDDPDVDVQRAAASHLSDFNDMDSLPRLLALLAEEPGDVPAPAAATLTFLAIEQPAELRQRVRSALDAFAARGDAAARQVRQLRWRLDDHPKRYPRIVKGYIGPDDDNETAGD